MNNMGKNSKSLIVLIFFCILSFSYAETYHVSTAGNDSQNGTAEFPYATFNKANTMLSEGDSLLVFGGTYSERMRITQNGSAENPIMIQPAEGESVIIDVDFSEDNCVSIEGNYIHIRNFEVRNSNGTGVDLGGQYIEARNFIVHECETHGTYADGQHILIEGHTIYHTNLENENRNWSNGWGSALKVRVGGDDITIRRNTVFHNYGEGIAATRGTNILIQENRVYDNFAVNIYVDNSYNVVVERNFVTCTGTSGYEYLDGSRPTGIAIAEEEYAGWGAQLENIMVRNNIVAWCERSLVYWGCDLNGVGGMKDVTIVHNTFWGSMNTAVSISYEPYKTENSVIANNIIQQPDDKPAWIEDRTGLDMHHNFWVDGPPESWTNASGDNDLSGDILLAGTPSYDSHSYKLSESSPARDAADASFNVEDDFEGKQRTSAQSPGKDIGAFEYGDTPLVRRTGPAIQERMGCKIIPAANNIRFLIHGNNREPVILNASNVLGRRVWRSALKPSTNGVHFFSWNIEEKKPANGIYFFNIRQGTRNINKRFLVTH